MHYGREVAETGEHFAAVSGLDSGLAGFLSIVSL